MRILRHSGAVTAPRDRVFALLEDARLSDQLNPPFLRTEVLESPWLPRPAARTRLALVYRGSRFDLETELAEYRRGHFLLERQVAGPFASYEHAVSVEDEADSTRLTEVLAYSVPFGLLGRLFDRITLRADLESVLAARCQRLRQLLERDPSTTAT